MDFCMRQANLKEQILRYQFLKNANNFQEDNTKDNLESVVDSLIQATRAVEFDNGLRTGIFPGGFWYHYSPGSIYTPSWDGGWSWVQFSCHMDPCQTKF